MLRKITLLFSLVCTLATMSMAQRGEFPWQVGRTAAPSSESAPSFLGVHIHATGYPDGAVTVVLHDLHGLTCARVHAYSQHGEIILPIPKHLANGLYLYRIPTSGAPIEGKLVVQRRG